MPKVSLPFSLYPLDKKFVGPKPIEEAPEERIQKLETAGKLIIERKRNGHGGLIAVTGARSQHIEIYSRGVHGLTEKLPAVVEELREIHIPRDTLLVPEMVVTKDGIDIPSEFGRIASAGTANAIAVQRELPPVQIAFFNVVVYKGKLVMHLPYYDRLDIIHSIMGRHRSTNVKVVDVVIGPLVLAQSLVRERCWEGLVLYDRDAPSEFRLDSNTKRPPRPDGCWKWKPYDEGDFVATGWVPSTSTKFKGLVKDLLISQYDPVTNALVSWGKVSGSALSADDRRKYADDTLYPMVFEIEFERRTLNKRLINACILRRRTDKAPEECFSPAA